MPFWSDRQCSVPTQPQCGSDRELVMLISHPVSQVRSASSSSQSPRINGSRTQSISRERRVSSPELSQVKVMTARKLAASTAGIICQVMHQEEPRSILSLDVC